MKTYNGKPAVLTSKTPEQIIGHLWEPFCMWIRHRETSAAPVKLKEDDAARMANCIKWLEEAGYVVGGHKTGRKVDGNGNILFSVIMRNQTDQQFEGPELDHLKTLSVAEHRKIARGLLRQVKAMEEGNNEG